MSKVQNGFLASLVTGSGLSCWAAFLVGALVVGTTGAGCGSATPANKRATGDSSIAEENDQGQGATPNGPTAATGPSGATGASAPITPPSVPGVPTLSAIPDAIVQRESSTEITITVDRSGNEDELVIEASGLPSGVSAAALTLSPEQSSGVLVLQATDSATLALDWTDYSIDLSFAETVVSESARLKVFGARGALDTSFATSGVFSAIGRVNDLATDAAGRIVIASTAWAFDDLGMNLQRLSAAGALNLPESGTLEMGGRDAATVRIVGDYSVRMVGKSEDATPGFFRSTMVGTAGNLAGRISNDNYSLHGSDTHTASVDVPLSNNRSAIVGTVGSKIGIAMFSGSALDTGFSTDGKLLIANPTNAAYYVEGRGLFERADGKLLVVGEIQTSASASSFFLTSLTAAGDTDTTFGFNGNANVACGASAYNRLASVRQDASGKIWLIGFSRTAVFGGGTLCISRLSSEGSVEVTRTFADLGTDVMVNDAEFLDDGKLYIAGTHFVMAGGTPFLASFDAEGHLDSDLSDSPSLAQTRSVVSVTRGQEGRLVAATHYYQGNEVYRVHSIFR